MTDKITRFNPHMDGEYDAEEIRGMRREGPSYEKPGFLKGFMNDVQENVFNPMQESAAPYIDGLVDPVVQELGKMFSGGAITEDELNLLKQKYKETVDSGKQTAEDFIEDIRFQYGTARDNFNQSAAEMEYDAGQAIDKGKKFLGDIF